MIGSATGSTGGASTTTRSAGPASDSSASLSRSCESSSAGSGGGGPAVSPALQGELDAVAALPAPELARAHYETRYVIVNAEVATDRGEQIAASNALSASLARLVGVVERYPELKANENALRLQEELASTENRIAFARQAYNDAVMVFNTRLSVFPDLLVARMFSFVPAALFETDGASRAVPQVHFGAGRGG